MMGWLIVCAAVVGVLAIIALYRIGRIIGDNEHDELSETERLHRHYDKNQ